MPVTREWVKGLPEGTQKEHYQYIINGMESTDVTTKKLFKDIGLLLTSHPGNRPFLKASLNTHKKLGYYMIVGYDNYWNPKNKEISFDHCLPKRDVFSLCDSFFISPYQEWGGVMFSYFFQLYQGTAMLGNFPYIYCTNGDCIIEKPEGFEVLFDEFKKSGRDFYPIGWEENNGRPLFNTTGFFAKTPAIIAVMRHFRDHFLPLDNYEKYAEKMGNTESRFHIAIDELGFSVLKPKENPINTQIAVPGHGTFYKTMGFRHIHGEFNNAHRRKKIPPEPKYLDDRYMRSKIQLIKDYYNETDESKKQAILERWWSNR